MFRKTWMGFLGFCLMGLAVQSADAQKKNNDNIEMATDKDYTWLASIKDMTGTLTSINTMSVTFRLDTPHLVPNPQYRPPVGNNNQHAHLQSIYHQQAQVMATANPIQRQLRMRQLLASIQSFQYQQMAQAAAASSNPNNQPFTLGHQYKDFDLDLAENVAVRKLYMETEYDDKGNLKTYTKAELDKLRGNDSTKPGYQAKLDDLQNGLNVKVYLKMPKKTKSAETKKIDAKVEANAKDDDKAKDPAKTDQTGDKTKKADDKYVPGGGPAKPVITMIVILQSLDLPTPDMPAAKKKKAS